MPESEGTYIPTLQFQPYVAPYTQAPVKEFDDFGKLLNERYDTNIANYDKLNEVMNQLQVSDADQHIKQGLLSDTRDAISNVVQNGDWENARSPVRQIANRFTTDPIIAKATLNYQKAQKLQEDARQAEMNGKPQIQFKDINNFSTVDPDTGKIRDLDTSGVFQDRLDYQGKMNQMFEGLHANASGNKTNNMIRDPDTGQLYQAGSGYTSSGITKQQVIDAANKNFGSYLASSEGQQRLKVLTSKNSDNANPVDLPSAISLMKQELINTGLNKVFHESSTESFTKPDRYNKGMAGATPNSTLINDISYQQNQDLDGLINGLTKQPRFTKDPNPFRIGITEPGGIPSKGSPIINPKGDSPTPSYQIPDKMKEMYSNLRATMLSSIDTKGKTKDQIDDIVNPKIKDYLNNIKNSKIQPKLLAPNDTKDIDATNNFFRNGAYQSAEYLDPNTGQKVSWNKIYKDATGTDFDKATPGDVKKIVDDLKITGQYSPDNPFYDMTNRDPDFAMSRKVMLGSHNYVVGAFPQDKGSQDYGPSHLAAEITSSKRTGLPIKLSHDLMVVPGPNNEGYYVKQGDGAPRGKSDGAPLSLEDVLAITIPHGVTPEK